MISAAVAQSVERRLGKAEVGGSSPLGSSKRTFGFPRVLFSSIGIPKDKETDIFVRILMALERLHQRNSYFGP